MCRAASSVVCCSLIVACGLLRVVRCLMFVAGCSLLIVCCLLFVVVFWLAFGDAVGCCVLHVVLWFVDGFVVVLVLVAC